MNSSVWAVWAARAVRGQPLVVKTNILKSFKTIVGSALKKLHKIKVEFFFDTWKKNYEF